MKFVLNISKKYAIVVIALLIVVGFGIAQTPPNPGHTASQVNIGPPVNDNLESWANSADSVLDNHDTRIVNLESGRWIPITPALTASYLCWPNGVGTCSPGLISSGSYSGIIPSNAKSFLVYAAIYSGNAPAPATGQDPTYFEIYTQEGSTRYSYRLLAMGPNSDTFWLPVTSDANIYVNLVGSSLSNANTRLRIIGYK